MFSSRIDPDLTPNRISLAACRIRDAGIPIADLTESNPTRAGFVYPESLLAALSHPRGLRYRPDAFGLSSAREAVSEDFKRRGLEVPPGRIVLTASTSEAYSVLFKLLCNPGDRVLVPRPSYPLFEHLTRLDAIGLETYDLEYHGLWSIDVDSLEANIPLATRALLLVNPNNPTGSFVTAEELRSLAVCCRRHRLALIGDEVFLDYRLDVDGGVTSVLQQEEALTFSLGGLSKSAGLPQVKLGWLAVQGPPGLVAQALDRLEIITDTYLSVSTPVQEAAPTLIELGADIRRQIKNRLSESLDCLRATASAYPACRVLRAEGGWYAVVQVPSTEPEEALVLDLLERDHVLVHPGYFYDFPQEAFMIVSLLPPADEFGPAVRKMCERFAAVSR